MADESSSVAVIKAKANALMKGGKYVEAIMEYSEGITLQPANAVLYSNRSLAFLKLDQHFFALKDAETTIQLVPDWAKGYYRKGQAELEAEMFDLAVATFQDGLKACPLDEVLQKALEMAKEKEQSYFNWKRKTLKRYTIFAGVIGSLLVISDMMWQPGFSYIKYPWLRAIVVTFSAFLGYILASMVISFQRGNKATLLQPPPELLSGSDLDYTPTASTATEGVDASLGDLGSSMKSKAE